MSGRPDTLAIVQESVSWVDKARLEVPSSPVANEDVGPLDWRPVNLAEIGERPPVKPTLGVLGLTYPGKRHIFSGPPESAKTIAVYIEIIAVIRAGGLVVLIDFEMGEHDALGMLRDLGATDDEIATIHYIAPETAATPAVIAWLVSVGPALVVIDAAAGAYDLQGLDDNKRLDVERFARIFVRPFFKAGIATIVLDHVVKNTESRGRYSIGSERKLGVCDVHLGFETVKTLSRGTTGLVRVSVNKDRPAWLPRPTLGTLKLASDPDTHAITWTFGNDAPVEESDEWRPTALMEKVSKHLESVGKPVARGAIVEAVHGQRKYVLRAIDCLIEDGYAVDESGPHGARLTRTVKPFRVPDPFSAVPENGSSLPVLPFSPPTRGNGNENGSGEVERLERLAQEMGLE